MNSAKRPTASPQIPGYLTAEQAGHRLGLSADTITQYRRRGLIEAAMQIGMAYLYAEAEISRFAQEKRRPGNPNFKRKPA